MKRESVLQGRATRLLNQVGTAEPPVDVETIARSLGARLEFEPDEGDLSGALYRDGESIVIAVNSSDAWVRQRFSIAHEIGHLVLHTEQDLFIDRYYPQAPEEEMPDRFHRDGLSSQAINRHEIEANKFAACLLMPRQFLLEDIASLRKPVRSDDVEKLARRYDVSQQAMLFRLQNLRVPVDQA